VGRLPRQVEPAGLCPDLLVEDSIDASCFVQGDFPLSIVREVELRAFLNEYLGKFFHLEGGFFDYCNKYNNFCKFYIRNKALQFENFQKLNLFLEECAPSHIQRFVKNEIQASLIERQKTALISMEYIDNHRMMNALEVQMEARIEAQNAAWVGEVNQRFHQVIQTERAAQLHQSQQKESAGFPNGGFRLVPLSHSTSKGYILSSGGGSSGFGGDGNNGFGSGGFGGDGLFNGGGNNGESPIFLLVLVLLYGAFFLLVFVISQKILGLIADRYFEVCRKFRQSLNQFLNGWHRKKRRRKILKRLLRIYAWLLMSVPLLMALPAGEAFFLDTMEALGIPAAFRFLRWFCRLFRYLMLLVLFLKSAGMGLGFLQYAYKAIEPIIGEISKYIAMSGQASPQIFLSKLLQWFFLVQLGYLIDILINKRKYFYIFLASLMVLVCILRMSLMFSSLSSFALMKIPELSLLTGCQAGRLLCLSAVVLILKRQRVSYVSTLFFVVFLYYFRLYQMVFLGSIPLFPNSLK